MRYDRQGDQHYDVISAFIKSVRGSDVDAALHYLARMIEAGEDPRFIARRLVILASEDIGLADPTALTTAVAAAQAVQLIGMPEARLNLAQATIALAVAPKSNAVITAIDAAIADVRAGKIGPVPAAPARRPLRRARRSSATASAYDYSHDEPYGIAEQQYAPDVVAGRASTTSRPRSAPRPRSRSAGSGSAGSSAATRDRVGHCELPMDRARRRVALLALPCVLVLGRACCWRVRVAAAARPRRALAEARRRDRGLRDRLDAPARRSASVAASAATSAAEEFVITRLGEPSRERRAACRRSSRPAVRRPGAARDAWSRPPSLAPRRAPGAGAGDPQPDPVRDAARGQARPQAAARRAARGAPRVARPGSAPSGDAARRDAA